ncbi:hypothetical protein [Variovorax sp. W6]|uniref:hypothetical protein n=1 Tax=Variovorax sp. W6 TaxID=3093895 RepID=UPI003D8059AD
MGNYLPVINIREARNCSRQQDRMDRGVAMTLVAQIPTLHEKPNSFGNFGLVICSIPERKHRPVASTFFAARWASGGHRNSDRLTVIYNASCGVQAFRHAISNLFGCFQLAEHFHLFVCMG